MELHVHMSVLMRARLHVICVRVRLRLRVRMCAWMCAFTFDVRVKSWVGGESRCTINVNGWCPSHNAISRKQDEIVHHVRVGVSANSLTKHPKYLTQRRYFTDDVKYAEHAADNIRAWFIDPETRMNPHTRYAHVQRGYNNNEGISCGVMETKDLFFLLDAVRLLTRAGAVSAADVSALKDWLAQFSEYLLTSKQGQEEYYTLNNHGTYYDVQLAAIAAYLDNLPLFFNHTERAKGRILAHFAADGSLSPELKCPKNCLQYTIFTLHGWYALARMAANAGVDLWHFHPKNISAPSLLRGAQYVLGQLNPEGSHPQVDLQGMEAMLFVYYMAREIFGEELHRAKDAPSRGDMPHVYDVKGNLSAHDGVLPYWNLGLTTAGL